MDIPLLRPTVEGVRKCYRFEGEVAVGRLFGGLVNMENLVSPTGFEPVLLP